MRTLLSPEEWERAGRFRSEVDRARFIMRRAGLRKILASYLRALPEQLSFRYSKYGKPFVAYGDRFGPAFSIAHSGDITLVVVAHNSDCAAGTNLRVGVDIEQIRDLGDIRTVTDISLTQTEQASLAALPVADQTLGLLACFTAKEALLKAYGTGLYVDPRQVEVGVDLGTGTSPSYVDIQPFSGDARWWMHHLWLPGCIGALALQPGPGELFWQHRLEAATSHHGG